MHYGTRRFRRQPGRRIPLQRRQPPFQFRFFIVPLQRWLFSRQFPPRRFIRRQFSEFITRRVHGRQFKTDAAYTKAVSTEAAFPSIVFITQASPSPEAGGTSSPASAASKATCTVSCCYARDYPRHR